MKLGDSYRGSKVAGILSSAVQLSMSMWRQSTATSLDGDGKNRYFLGQVESCLCAHKEVRPMADHRRQQRCVLIVDGSSEAREVLRTVLERRGLEILEARGAEQGLELARANDPDLVVLDMESVPESDWGICSQFQECSAGKTPLVLLGTASCTQRPLPASEVVTKPYHYAPLIRRIEELLARAGTAEDICAAHAEVTERALLIRHSGT